MTQLPWIGLGGLAGAGKTLAADYLVTAYGYRKMSFADGVKAVALAINPLISYSEGGLGVPVYLAEHVEAVGWQRAKLNHQVRRLLQRIGTEAGRNIFGPQVWVDLAMQRCMEDVYYEATSAPFVFDDVRFDNEALAVQGGGWSYDPPGLVLVIERPGLEPINDHASERGLSPELVHQYLTNDGDTEALWASLDLVMATYFSTLGDNQ